jgi:hypothetical protein
MPAVEFTRLREQIANVLGMVDRPEEFYRALNGLLYQHSQHVYRAGESISSRPLLPAYRVPVLVYRQLELELSAAARRQPEQLLAAISFLWQDDHLEPRLLAALALGQIPLSHSTQVLERLGEWARPDEDRQVLEALLERGTITLRRSAPDGLFALIRNWMDEKKTTSQQLGLRALEAISADPDFEAIPSVFRLVSPLVLAPPPGLINDLHHCLAALANRTPAETAYFLRQSLGASADATTARLVRRILPEFEPDLQASLRSALRSRGAL